MSSNTNNTEVLFKPFNYGSLSLKNRIVMAPMTRQMSPNNIPNEHNAEYYAKRAKGGVGLIITEGTLVNHKAANAYENAPHIHGETALAGWKNVVDAVHTADPDAKIAAQLWHVGAIRRPGNAGPDPEVPGYSPSGMTRPGKITGHAMTQEDINEVTQAFIQAAIDAKEVGFDAIELHGAHGYLLDQFFWEGSNQRTDQYGGTIENRTRFVVDIVKGIRKALGDEYPIILRMSQWKQQDYTARLAETPEELNRYIQPLSNAGVDIFHCSNRRFWEAEFEGSDKNLAGWVQELSGKPAITVGSISLNKDFLPDEQGGFKNGEIADIKQLISRMENGEFELAAVGRALISNPDWANKIQNDELKQLRPYSKEDLATLN